METSRSKNIFIEWLAWQFKEMPMFLLLVWKNYILFALNYFSLPILLRSFFSPWRKYKWRYPRGFDVGQILTTSISNIFSRIMGALVRIVLIIVGILFQIFVVVAGFVIFILWILMPFLAIAGLIFVFSN